MFSDSYFFIFKGLENIDKRGIDDSLKVLVECATYKQYNTSINIICRYQ